MDHTALFGDPDALHRKPPSHSERCAALKRHLRDVVLILESFDQPSRDKLEQDEQYNDLASRFISAFTSFALPELVNKVGQGIKNGPRDMTTNNIDLSVKDVTLPNVPALSTQRAIAKPRVASASQSVSRRETPLSPPSYPLAVRSPYLSTWVPQGRAGAPRISFFVSFD